MRPLYVLIAAVLVVAVFAVIYSFMGRSSSSESRDLSQVITDTQAGRVERIEVRGDRLTIHLTNGESYKSRKEEDTSITEVLQNAGVKMTRPDGVEISVHRRSALGSWIGLLLSFLPLLLIGAGIWFLVARASRPKPPTA